MEQELLVHLDSGKRRDELRAFLADRGCAASHRGEATLAVGDCGRVGIARLVALVEQWRSGAPSVEATLELEGRRTILRTDA